jgi:hypothetical protein
LDGGPVTVATRFEDIHEENLQQEGLFFLQVLSSFFASSLFPCRDVCGLYPIMLTLYKYIVQDVLLSALHGESTHIYLPE